MPKGSMWFYSIQTDKDPKVIRWKPLESPCIYDTATSSLWVGIARGRSCFQTSPVGDNTKLRGSSQTLAFPFKRSPSKAAVHVATWISDQDGSRQQEYVELAAARGGFGERSS